MAGISNIIGAYNINPKRVSSKLAFEMGQVFSARIVSADELSKELILKLLDGWQFTAKLEKPLDFVPQGLVKFQVEGFQDGKLQIRIVKDNKEEEKLDKTSVEDFLIQNNIDADKEDYKILEKMIKHNMPLTKENISRVKSIIDFKAKIEQDVKEQDSFVEKYVKSKGIDINTDKGKNIEKLLKGFFDELRKASVDDIFTMLENNIDLTEDNIKSFLKVSKENSIIYKDLKAADSELTKQTTYNNDENMLKEVYEQENEPQKIEQPGNRNSISEILKNDLKGNELSPEEIKLYEGLEKLFDNDDIISVKDSNSKEIRKGMDQLEADESGFEAKEAVTNAKLKALEGKLKDIEKLDNREQQVELVREQLKNKTEEMKSIIQNILSKEGSPKPEILDKVFETLKEYINDFKVFNSLSSQYYMLDVPINLSRDEYNCKLLVKDDRKSGKRIDSKNVSLVVSVKTLGMGTVDAYIKVREHNMYIDIKCEEQWVNMLSLGKNKLINELSNNNYIIALNVEKKVLEVSLANCSEFFEDSSLGSINARA